MIYLDKIDVKILKGDIKQTEKYLRLKGHKIRRYKSKLFAGLTEKVFIDGEKARFFSLEGYGKYILEIYIKEKQIEDYEDRIENKLDFGLYD